MCLSANRKFIEDEVGVDLARMLILNKNVRKIELEGNKLGPKTAKEFSNVLRYSTTLKFLDLDNNMLTNDGEDPTGLKQMIEALKVNKSLLSLNIANNRLDEQIGKAFEEAMQVNTTLIDFDFSFNNFEVDTIRKLQASLRRNKEIYDANGLREWTERTSMREEDAHLVQKYLKEQTIVDRTRMEEEEFE